MAHRRVVVTGMGAVSPLGTSAISTWKGIISGKTGVRNIKGATEDEQKIFDALPSRIAAQVQRGSHSEGLFDATRVYKKRKIPTSVSFAISATREAMIDADWLPRAKQSKERTGVAIGTGISGLQDLLDANDSLRSKGYRRVSPYVVPNALANSAAGMVSIEHNLMGPCHTVSTACTTGAHAIGDAFRFIKYGDAEVMVAGGCDACILPVIVAGFCRAKALTVDFNDNPDVASRPFDVHRSGFVIGEGAAILVLEELQHAKDRGARIYAEIAGYGLSGDGHHITAPEPEGSGAARCMTAALREANVTPADVAVVNCHATSTPMGDVIETAAVASVLGNDAVVTSTKGHTGHLLGAAGAIEAMITVAGLANGVAPGTLNIDTIDPKCEVNVLTNPSNQLRDGAALTNSFGFGGTNASLVFLPYH